MNFFTQLYTNDNGYRISIYLRRIAIFLLFLAIMVLLISITVIIISLVKGMDVTAEMMIFSVITFFVILFSGFNMLVLAAVGINTARSIRINKKTFVILKKMANNDDEEVVVL